MLTSRRCCSDLARLWISIGVFSGLKQARVPVQYRAGPTLIPQWYHLQSSYFIIAGLTRVPTVLGQDIAHAQPASLEDTNDGEASNDPVDSTRATDHSMFIRDAISAVISEDQNANPTQSLLPERVVPNLIGFSVETFDPSFGVFDRRTIILPTQSIADDLVRWYWRHVHTIFPILHRPTFEAQYQTLWSSDTHFAPSGGANNGEELVFHAILNMVMALGCRRHEAMSQSGREYYERSQRLISVDTLDASSSQVRPLPLFNSVLSMG